MQEIQVLGMYRDIVEEARDLISVHSMNMEVGRTGVHTKNLVIHEESCNIHYCAAYSSSLSSFSEAGSHSKITHDRLVV